MSRLQMTCLGPRQDRYCGIVIAILIISFGWRGIFSLLSAACKSGTAQWKSWFQAHNCCKATQELQNSAWTMGAAPSKRKRPTFWARYTFHECLWVSRTKMLTAEFTNVSGLRNLYEKKVKELIHLQILSEVSSDNLCCPSIWACVMNTWTTYSEFAVTSAFGARSGLPQITFVAYRKHFREYLLIGTQNGSKLKA